MGDTSIEWTDKSWPVVNGCRRKSKGCERCYAEQLAATRLRHHPKYKGLAVYGKNGPHWTGATRLWEPELVMPLRLRKHSRIFVADMGDLFYEAVPFDDVDRVFAVMAICAMRENGPSHWFQVLTKRADRQREYASASPEEMRRRIAPIAARMMEDSDGWHDLVWTSMPWPLPNVIMMVSAEDQEAADERIPQLLKTPAVARGVSYEPALGPIDFGEWLGGRIVTMELSTPSRILSDTPAPRLDWVIAGGESGRKPRPCNIEWIRQTIAQCRDASVACFVKQLGSRPWDGAKEIEVAVPMEEMTALLDPSRDVVGTCTEGNVIHVTKKGGSMDEWPPDLCVREFPKEAA